MSPSDDRKVSPILHPLPIVLPSVPLLLPAKYLLLHTGKSVKEIAEEVGYKDAFYFCKVFKKMEGVAPSLYRVNT
jgi:hypothetical protein